MNKLKKILIISVFLLPTSLWAASIEVGFKTTQASILVLDSSENELGEIFSNYQDAPYLSLKSEPQTFNNSQWGYFIELNTSSYYLDQQDYNQQINIGTSMKIFSTHLTPVLFYKFNSLDTPLGEFSSLVGLGVGIGYMKVNGSINTDLVPTRNTIQVNGKGFGTTIGVYLETSLNHFVAKVSSYGPAIDIGAYTYELYDIAFSLGYRVEFNMHSIFND